MWEHAEASLDIALSGSWALHGLCEGKAAPARYRSCRAAEEGALVALVNVMQTKRSFKDSSACEAARAALAAIVGHDAELRRRAEAVGVEGKWLAKDNADDARGRVADA